MGSNFDLTEADKTLTLGRFRSIQAELQTPANSMESESIYAYPEDSAANSILALSHCPAKLDRQQGLYAKNLKDLEDASKEIGFSWSAVAHLSDLLIFDAELMDMEIDGDRHEVRIIWK